MVLYSTDRGEGRESRETRKLLSGERKQGTYELLYARIPEPVGGKLKKTDTTEPDRDTKRGARGRASLEVAGDWGKTQEHVKKKGMSRSYVNREEGL